MLFNENGLLRKGFTIVVAIDIIITIANMRRYSAKSESKDESESEDESEDEIRSGSRR